MGYGGNRRVIFEVPHWQCPCGQPNCMDRDQCLACEKTPISKTELRVKGRPTLDSKYGLIGIRSD